MTFKDLQKLIQQQQSGPGDNPVLQRLRDKPFWLWDPTSHKQADRVSRGDCCFNQTRVSQNLNDKNPLKQS